VADSTFFLITLSISLYLHPVPALPPTYTLSAVLSVYKIPILYPRSHFISIGATEPIISKAHIH